MVAWALRTPHSGAMASGSFDINSLPDILCLPSAKSKAKDRDELHLKVVPDGRACNCCGSKDDEADPVRKHQRLVGTRCWGYPPKFDKQGVLRNVGFSCAYCMRVHESRFEHRMTMTTLVSKKGDYTYF